MIDTKRIKVGEPKKPKGFESYERLIVAIIKQAVLDWRYLDAGGEEVPGCNYDELIRFFESSCNGLISGDAAKKILDMLIMEGR